MRVCFFKGKLLTFIEKTWVHGRPGKDSRHPETIPKMEQVVGKWGGRWWEKMSVWRSQGGGVLIILI